MNQKDTSNNLPDNNDNQSTNQEKNLNPPLSINESNLFFPPISNYHMSENQSSPIFSFTKVKRRRKTSSTESSTLKITPISRLARMEKTKVSKLSNQYNSSNSADFIKQTLEGFKSTDEMEILTTLSDLCSKLSIANDSIGEDANFNELIKQLIVLFDKFPMLPDISMIALNCINYLLDINPRSTNTVIKFNGVEKIVRMAQNVEYIDCVESAIKAIEKMSYENPFVLIEKDGFYAVLAFIDFFDMNLRKIALKACMNMAKIGNNVEYIKKHIQQAIPNLTMLTKLSGNTDIEKCIVDLSIQSFYYIMIGVKNFNYSMNHNDFCKEIIQFGLLENLYEIFIRFINVHHDDNEEGDNINVVSNIIVEKGQTLTINVDTVKTILKIFEAFCLMSEDITNIILNNNTLEMIYKVLNREVGSGLSDLNKKKLTTNSYSLHQELFGLLAALFPAKSKKNEINRILHENNKCYFLYFSDKILTLLIDNILHISSSSSMIGVLRIIYMYCVNTPKEYIIKYINEKKLSNIISKNLDSKDTSYIIEVLNLVELIMSRVPEQFFLSFLRDGVHGNIKSLITVQQATLYISKEPVSSIGINQSDNKPIPSQQMKEEAFYDDSISDEDPEPQANINQMSNDIDAKLMDQLQCKMAKLKNEMLGPIPLDNDNQPQILSKMPSSYHNKPRIASPKTIVENIHTKAQKIIEQHFSDKDIQELITKTKSGINPIEIMSKLIEYKNIIKDNKCTSVILKEIIELILEKEVTFYEIEKSEIVLYLTYYFDTNFLLNYSNAIDSEKESTVVLSNTYNKKIVSKLTELFNIFDNNTQKIESFVKILQQCISSMNCFKLYLVEFGNSKNFSQIFASALSVGNQRLGHKTNISMNYDKEDKSMKELTNDKDLQKIIKYFEAYPTKKLSIGSEEKIETFKEKIFALPMENINNLSNLLEQDAEEADLYNIFHRYFKKENADMNEDDGDGDDMNVDKLLNESDHMLTFLQELKTINKEKEKAKEKEKQQETISNKNTEPSKLSKKEDQTTIDQHKKGKDESNLNNDFNIEKIKTNYDILFFIKLSNGQKHQIKSNITFTEFIQKIKSQFTKSDLITFIASMTISFNFIKRQLVSNDQQNETIITNQTIIKESSVFSLNDINIQQGDLSQILFEKYYDMTIINNKALYNIKRASPFFYLISTIELISSSFRNMFNLCNKINTNEFENLKMTSLLFKQVKDVYAITSQSIPSWCQQVNMSYPFFTGFSSRYLLFKVTAFDIKRSISNLYVYLRNFLGENLLEDKSISSVTSTIRRIKIKIHRDQILQDTKLLLNEQANYHGYIEFEYYNEVGTGMGPTLEYYSLISKELLNNTYLWYPTEDYSLFPMPIGGIKDIAKHKEIFECLGFVIARGLFDDRLLEIPLNSLFWDLVLDRPVNIDSISLVDKSIGQFLINLQRLSIKKKNNPNEPLLLNGKTIESCDLFFTLPVKNIPLKDNGDNIQVTSTNFEEYIYLMFKKLIIDGQKEWIDSFKQGFNKVFPVNNLKCFTSIEIEEIICGSNSTDDSWTHDSLSPNIMPMHGYTKDSSIYQGLITIMTQLNSFERKQFLLFVTGAPRLPIGGFKNLHPKLTVVMYQSENKSLDNTPDVHLPSVMTCQNYLKIPNYSSFEVLKEKLMIAIKEGNNAFHLS